MRGTPRIGWLALLIGLLIGSLLHLVSPAKPPLFDGIAAPPPPFRYISPPPDRASSNQPPLNGEAVVSVHDIKVSGAAVQTADGQAAAFFPPGSLQPSAGASQIRLRLDLVIHPPTPPDGYSLVGNVLQVTVIEEPSQSPMSIVKPYQLTIEIPPGPFDVLQLYDGTNWQVLQTNFESDRYPTVKLSAVGEVAATVRTSHTAALDNASNLIRTGLIIAAVVAAVGLGLLWAFRRRPRPAARAAPANRRGGKKGRPRSRSRR